MNTLINCLINFSILGALTACYTKPHTLKNPSPTQSKNSQKTFIYLEDLNPASPHKFWEQFFRERGAKMAWQVLQRKPTELRVEFQNLDRPLIPMADRLPESQLNPTEIDFLWMGIRKKVKKIQIDVGTPQCPAVAAINQADQVGLGIIQYLSYHHPTIEKLQLQGFIDQQMSQIPPGISQLACLKELDLSSNNLTDLPSEISNLIHLKRLVLSYNNSINQLPAAIYSLSQLNNLELRHISLTQLPLEIGSWISLTSLDLRNNHLIELPTSIGNLINLSCLCLENNTLRDLPSSMARLTKLQHLTLDNNHFTALPASLEHIINHVNFQVLDPNPWQEYRTISIEKDTLEAYFHQQLPNSLIGLCTHIMQKTAHQEEVDSLFQKLQLEQFNKPYALVNNSRIVYFGRTSIAATPYIPFYWDQNIDTSKDIYNMLKALKDKKIYLIDDFHFYDQLEHKARKSKERINRLTHPSFFR